MSDAPEISSDVSGLREAAHELAESRGGREVVTTPEPSGEGPTSLEEAQSNLSHDRLRRQARERQELEAYQKAADLSERPLPDSMSMDDAELGRQEIRELRATLQEVKEAQQNSYVRLQAEAAQAQQVQATNQSYEQSRQAAVASIDIVQQVIAQEIDALRTVWGDLTDAEVQQAYSSDEFFRETFDAARGRVALAQREQQQAVLGYAQGYEHLAQLHDQQFANNNADLAADPEALAAAGRGTWAMLQAHGYSQQQIDQGWRFGTGVLSNIRDYRVQQLLLNEWRSSEARKHLDDAQHASRLKSLPPVQRPGASVGNGYQDETELRALNRRLTERGTLKDAAKLLIAQRRWKGKG